MKTHNGMRPQDIVILLKIISLSPQNWQYRDLGYGLSISISEISDSLNRNHMAGLVDESRRRVHRQNLVEFIEHGLHYVFPQVPGTMVTGVPTAHSHPMFEKKFPAELHYAWPHENGSIRGLSVTPLSKGVPTAIEKDDKLYLLLAAIDIIRVGRVRELNFALEILRKNILRE